jgi:hypothetical protein
LKEQDKIANSIVRRSSRGIDAATTETTATMRSIPGSSYEKELKQGTRLRAFIFSGMQSQD